MGHEDTVDMSTSGADGTVARFRERPWQWPVEEPR